MIPKFRAIIETKKGKVLIYSKNHDVTFYQNYVQFWQGLTKHKISYENLMQYTGLDVNGEIYEQDIVFDPHSQTTGVVKWDEEGYRWSVETVEGASTTEPLSDWGTDITVIGNIYENPELMEATE